MSYGDWEVDGEPYTKKEGTEFKWTCASLELDCEGKEGIFALCDELKVPRPSHLIE